MGFRFHRSVSLFPGVRLNFSKSGMGLSLGPRGAKLSIGPRGTYANVGLPGTGLSWREKVNTSSGNVRRLSRSADALAARAERLAELNDQLTRLQAACDAANADLERITDFHLCCYLPDTPLPPFVGATRVGPSPEETMAPPALPPAPDKPANPLLHGVCLGAWALCAIIWLQKFSNKSSAIDPSIPVVAVIAALAVTAFLVFRHTGAKKDYAEALERHTEAAAQARGKYRADLARALQEWELTRQAAEIESREFERLSSDPLSRREYLAKCFAMGPWPREIIIDTDKPGSDGSLNLTVRLPEGESLPQSRFSVLKSQLTIREKPLSEAARHRLYARFAHAVLMVAASIAFRRAPEIRLAAISGYVRLISPKTGTKEWTCILSCCIPREAWEQWTDERLANMDPVEALTVFDLRRSMTKTGIFSAVEAYGLPKATQMPRTENQ